MYSLKQCSKYIIHILTLYFLLYKTKTKSKHQQLNQVKFSILMFGPSTDVKSVFLQIRKLKKTQEQEKIEEFNNKTTLEKKLQEKDVEIVEKEKEIISLAEKAKQLEDHVERMRKQLQEKEDETKNLNAKLELVSVANCKISEQTNDVLEAQSKITDLQNILEKQTQQISQMQNSLQAHTKLAAGLKIEKDNAIKYSKKLRDILEEVSTKRYSMCISVH